MGVLGNWSQSTLLAGGRLWLIMSMASKYLGTLHIPGLYKDIEKRKKRDGSGILYCIPTSFIVSKNIKPGYRWLHPQIRDSGFVDVAWVSCHSCRFASLSCRWPSLLFFSLSFFFLLACSVMGIWAGPAELSQLGAQYYLARYVGGLKKKLEWLAHPRSLFEPGPMVESDA